MYDEAVILTTDASVLERPLCIQQQALAKHDRLWQPRRPVGTAPVDQRPPPPRRPRTPLHAQAHLLTSPLPLLLRCPPAVAASLLLLLVRTFDYWCVAFLFILFLICTTTDNEKLLIINRTRVTNYVLLHSTFYFSNKQYFFFMMSTASSGQLTN